METGTVHDKRYSVEEGIVHEKLENHLLALETIPDGGTRAWCTVAGGWMALFATFGYLSSFGVYQDLYTRAGLSTTSNISWIGSMQLFLLVSMGLPAGKLLDTGYFKPCMLIGSFIFISSVFMLSLVHINSYYQIFLSQGVGMGLGAGMIYLPSMAVQAHHWKEHRALAMGIVITGSSCGGIVYPIMLNHLFHGKVGFAWGVRASAFLSLGLLIAANCLMSARLSKIKDEHTLKPGARDIFKDVPFWLATAGAFFVIWGLFFPYFYLQLYTVLQGLPSTFAFYTLTIQNGASIFGRILPNFLADKLGVLNMLIIVSFGTGIMIFSFFAVKDITGVTIFASLYGFFSGAVLSTFAPVIASFSSNVSELGLRMGLAYFVCSFAFLSGTPIDGALLGNGYPWFKPITFSGTTILVGVPFMIMGRAMRARRKGTQFI